MRGRCFALSVAFLCTLWSPALAVEGPTAAGPIGGTDIRSALPAPPGLYGGVILLGASTLDFLDGKGNTIPALRDAHLSKELAGPFFYYVPKTKLFEGSLGIGAIVPFGNQCGHLFAGTPDDCTFGVGDPYAEIDWSRFFGQVHPSKTLGALPILQGLSVLVGFGVVFPAGTYDGADLTSQALSIGNNTWDFAPSVAVTYTTRPLLAEGTEFSAKLFWNNYLENPATRYSAGDLLNLDFAITEHVGRFQLGLAGFYAVEVEDDRLLGVRIPPDGRRAEILELGPVLNYDMPERGSTFRTKALFTPFAHNTVTSWGVIAGWLKKF